ncbi:2-phospho-L-lactate guanylyltransferase [Gordonia sinesedis]
MLAVKSLDAAKTRLAENLDRLTTYGDTPNLGTRLDDTVPARRRDLVIAMLSDTVESVRAAGIDRVVVVTPDDAVLTAAAAVGAHGERESDDAPTLNRALSQGSEVARVLAPDAHTVLLVQADLPAARPDSLREILAVGIPRRLAMVADRGGDGTALLIRPVDLREPPSFGPSSAHAHRRAGADDLDPTRQRWPDVRTDVDTVEDLRAALRLGVGRHTRAVLGIADDAAAGRPPANGVTGHADAS